MKFGSDFLRYLLNQVELSVVSFSVAEQLEHLLSDKKGINNVVICKSLHIWHCKTETFKSFSALTIKNKQGSETAKHIIRLLILEFHFIFEMSQARRHPSHYLSFTTFPYSGRECWYRRFTCKPHCNENQRIYWFNFQIINQLHSWTKILYCSAEANPNIFASGYESKNWWRTKW